jgi:hypothetical protein
LKRKGAPGVPDGPNLQNLAASPLGCSQTCKNQQANNPQRCPKSLWTTCKKVSKLYTKNFLSKKYTKLAIYNLRKQANASFLSGFVCCSEQNKVALKLPNLNLKHFKKELPLALKDLKENLLKDELL